MYFVGYFFPQLWGESSPHLVGKVFPICFHIRPFAQSVDMTSSISRPRNGDRKQPQETNYQHRRHVKHQDCLRSSPEYHRRLPVRTFRVFATLRRYILNSRNMSCEFLFRYMSPTLSPIYKLLISNPSRMPHPYDPSKPTLILVNSFATTSDLYTSQYANPNLTSAMNLLAIELLGHGKTRTPHENFTYWDSALMSLQVMEALGVGKAFVLGTSQGGWITVRMALLAPEKIEGIVALGTSMDSESERTRLLGCWNGIDACTGPIDRWTDTKITSDFEPDDGFCNFLIDVGFGKDCGSSVRDFWTKTIKSNYQGNDGRKRARMAAINLRERDTLHGRLFDIRCPVMWLHGTSDIVYSVANAEQEIKMFMNSPEAKLITVENGQHFLSASHPKEVDNALIEFVQRWHN